MCLRHNLRVSNSELTYDFERVHFLAVSWLQNKTFHFPCTLPINPVFVVFWQDRNSPEMNRLPSFSNAIYDFFLKKGSTSQHGKIQSITCEREIYL